MCMRIYRRFQVLNVITNENFRDWVCMAYACVCLVSISTAFCLIKFRYQWNLVQIGFFLLLLDTFLLVSAVCIRLAIQLSLHSKDMINCLKKSDTTIRKVEAKFWKSCTPIEIWVGNFFSYTSPDFIFQVYGKIIFESVISLILATKGMNPVISYN
jgi:hypothetical protein